VPAVRIDNLVGRVVFVLPVCQGKYFFDGLGFGLREFVTPQPLWLGVPSGGRGIYFPDGSGT
jgi:hypothetical protein